MIIAIDFDGTCVTHDYPDIGKDIGAIPILQKLSEQGHKLILWTMRSGETLSDAVKWFEQNNIKLFGINDNPEQKTWTTSNKAYAQLYIDDASLGAPLLFNPFKHRRPFINWRKVEDILTHKGIIQ